MLTKIPHLVKTDANVESCACTQRCRLSHNAFSVFVVVVFGTLRSINVNSQIHRSYTFLTTLDYDDTPTTGNSYSQLCGLVCRRLPSVSRGKDEANTF